MLHLPISTLLAAVLALPLFSQDPAAKTTASPAAGPVLVLKTSDAGIAHHLGAALGYRDDLPDAPVDSHYVVSLGADHTCTVKTDSGSVDLFELTADPAALMDLFADQIEARKPMVRGALTVGMQQAGMSAKDAAKLLEDVFAFPRQLQLLTLKVVGDPMAIPDTGLDVTLDVAARSGSGFASLVDKLAPCAQGAPDLRSEHALLQFQLSLAPAAMAAIFQPFRDFVVGMTNKGEEQRKRAAAMYDQWSGMYDGGVSMMLDEPFGARMLIGVLDGDKLRQLMVSEDYLAMVREQQMPNRDLETEVTPDAFEHRGAKFVKTRVSGGDPNPMMPDGAIETRSAVVGNTLLMAMGGGDAAAKALVDGVLDGKAKRVPLPDAAVVSLTMDVRRLLQAVMASVDMGGPAAEDVPSSLVLRVGKRGAGLQLKLHLQ